MYAIMPSLEIFTLSSYSADKQGQEQKTKPKSLHSCLQLLHNEVEE